MKQSLGLTNVYISRFPGLKTVGTGREPTVTWTIIGEAGETMLITRLFSPPLTITPDLKAATCYVPVRSNPSTLRLTHQYYFLSAIGGSLFL
jgi:hypothetical protein